MNVKVCSSGTELSNALKYITGLAVVYCCIFKYLFKGLSVKILS